MQRSLLQRFRRITYSTGYLPEIDGLRFLAIFCVVVILHITHYIDEKFYGDGLFTNAYWKNFVLEGGNGVPLFFVISGFILSLPFARWRLNGAPEVTLRRYYLRRVTRLEPPYLILLAVFFVAHVWILQKYSFAALLPHFFASAGYVHSLVYGSASWILPIAWSLEVEVQFYLLAPLFCCLFLIPSRGLRWLICFAVIAGSAICWFDVWRTGHLLMYLQFFFSGIWLADLYCTRTVLVRHEGLGLATGLLALAGFIFLPTIHYAPGYFAKLVCLFLLVHAVLTNAPMRRLFSAKAIVLVGGMCYSIYLLHFAVVSFTGQLLLRSGLPLTNKALLPPFFLLFITAVLLVAAVYFLWVEKPFMKPFDLGRHKAS